MNKEFWFFCLGALILFFVTMDVMLTTFAPTGTGIITGRLRRWVWRLFLYVSGKKGSSPILNYAGPITVIVWLMGWLILVWVGNFFIYSSDPDSIVASPSLRSTTWSEKFYFTGYTLSTLGIGDFVPYGQGWQIYSSFISFTGFILITIILTYLYSVVTNDINRRKVSLKMYHYGSTPQEILLRFWDGQGFSRINTDLSSLAEQVLQVAQNHMAYPVLHNFHSTKREAAFVINLTCLDEALTILLLYKPRDIQPSLAEMYQLRSAITYYMQTLQNAFISPADEEPPPPDLSPLLKNGLPLYGKDFNELTGDDIQLRRKLLLGLLNSQGWSWDAIYQHHSRDPLDNWLTTMRKQRQFEWPAPYQNEEKDRNEQVKEKDNN